MSSITSFALNNACTVTVNFDPFFGFHSYTFEGKSVMLSTMDESDLLIVRKVLEERYNFYKTARELVEHITKLINESKENSPPKEVCKYKQMLKDTFNQSMESMEGEEVASEELVLHVLEHIRKSETPEWSLAEVPGVLELPLTQEDTHYPYAVLIKQANGYFVKFWYRSYRYMWTSDRFDNVLEALNFIARRFW